ncbi:MAG: TPM domain-containing protein [Candidatus Aminicenantes bacterium]|nr:TPM domain-containing protein [Candidatus Aminicenantes bacterium]
MNAACLAKKVFCLFLLAASFRSPALRAERIEDVPNPRQSSGAFVTDNGGVLGPEYVVLIDGVCRDLQAKTTIELAVITVGSLGGLTIEEFAVKLFQRFAIGVAGRDNGLLLLCSRDDRMLRLEVGYGLEATIPDALASRLLDDSGLPFLHQGLFGRGLFLAAREIAKTAAAAQGVVLAVADPEPWPEQPVPAAAPRRPEAEKKPGWDPLLSSLYFAGGILAFALLASAWTLLRFNRARGRAARAKIAGKTPASVILAWIAAVASFILVANLGGQFLAPFIAMLAAPSLATFGRLFTGRLLKRRLASYRLPCSKCGAPMEMVKDALDDPLLSEEEAAEERAGGMDYEFWRCPGCGAEERLAVKLNKASKCPQCRRRTLKSSSTTLVAATKEHGGRARVTETCVNPACGYTKTREHNTPRLSSPPSSSSGTSRSSSPSFGGGRSGGAGASKKF